jgi:hypothetical protein
LCRNLVTPKRGGGHFDQGYTEVGFASQVLLTNCKQFLLQYNEYFYINLLLERNVQNLLKGNVWRRYLVGSRRNEPIDWSNSL